MKMILRKSFRKRIAILLLAVFLIPLVPIVPVSATGGSPFPFDYPSSDTFYPVDFVIKLVNAGSADYLRVRTDNGQKIAHWVFMDTHTLPVTPDPFSKYTFYDDLGNVVDNPFANTNDNNLLLVRDDYTDLTGGAYGIVVASNATLTTYEYGESLIDSDSYIYFYQNYMSYAITPTPTPAPEPDVPISYFPAVIDAKYTVFTYYDAVKLVMMRFYSESENKYMIRYFTLFSERNSSHNLKSYPVVTSIIDNGGTVRVDLYNQIPNGYSPKWIMYTMETNGVTYFDSLDQILGSTVSLGNHVMSINSSTKISGDLYYFTYTPTDDYYFEDAVFGNINSDGTVDFDGSGGATPTATPTPIPSPTFVPQPSEYPTPPADPPDEGEDSNWTGLFGWLKKLVSGILSIPVKIGNAILSALKYVFIPDLNKIKQVYSDLNDKVGISQPAKFDFDPAALTRPSNVYYEFHTIPINGQASETTRVTIIDFGQVDDWLETSAGRMIIRITKACFSLLLWAYMIYVFTKHIGAINYTDAQRLEGVYARSNEFKGEETDV